MDDQGRTVVGGMGLEQLVATVYELLLSLLAPVNSSKIWFQLESTPYWNLS